MIDLDKLTPRPWSGVTRLYRETVEATGDFALAGGSDGFDCIAIFKRETDCDFAALAGNWLSVQERRKWCVSHEAKFGWWLEDDWDKDGERFDPRRFASVLEAWQAAVDYDRELTAKGE